MVSAWNDALLFVEREGMKETHHVGVWLSLYGMPETTTHLHDNHNTPESDGNPDDYYPKTNELHPADNDPGRFKDFHWANMPAGNDPNETMGTLWYHDHRHDFTAANTYKGLVGFYLVFDDIDNDDETARLPGNLSLPSGKYDVQSGFAHRGPGDSPTKFQPARLDKLNLWKQSLCLLKYWRACSRPL